MFYDDPPEKRRVVPNTVDLEIDDDDDLLPISRRRAASTSTSEDEVEDEKEHEETKPAKINKPQLAPKPDLSQYHTHQDLAKRNFKTGMLHVVGMGGVRNRLLLVWKLLKHPRFSPVWLWVKCLSVVHAL